MKDYLVHDNCLQIFKDHLGKRSISVLDEYQKASRTLQEDRFQLRGKKTFLRVKQVLYQSRESPFIGSIQEKSK